MLYIQDQIRRVENNIYDNNDNNDNNDTDSIINTEFIKIEDVELYRTIAGELINLLSGYDYFTLGQYNNNAKQRVYETEMATYNLRFPLINIICCQPYSAVYINHYAQLLCKQYDIIIKSFVTNDSPYVYACTQKPITEFFNHFQFTNYLSDLTDFITDDSVVFHSKEDKVWKIHSAIFIDNKDKPCLNYDHGLYYDQISLNDLSVNSHQQIQRWPTIYYNTKYGLMVHMNYYRQILKQFVCKGVKSDVLWNNLWVKWSKINTTPDDSKEFNELAGVKCSRPLCLNYLYGKIYYNDVGQKHKDKYYCSMCAHYAKYKLSCNKHIASNIKFEDIVHLIHDKECNYPKEYYDALIQIHKHGLTCLHKSLFVCEGLPDVILTTDANYIYSRYIELNDRKYKIVSLCIK